MPHWWKPTSSLDATRIGGQAYTQAELRAVADALYPATYHRPLNTAGIALTTGVPGRTVRQILSDLDGRLMLIGKRAAGLFVCHYADEADEYSHALDRHWRSERARCQRRGSFGPLPRRQGLLFDDFDDYLADEEDDE